MLCITQQRHQYSLTVTQCLPEVSKRPSNSPPKENTNTGLLWISLLSPNHRRSLFFQATWSTSSRGSFLCEQMAVSWWNYCRSPLSRREDSTESHQKAVTTATQLHDTVEQTDRKDHKSEKSVTSSTHRGSVRLPQRLLGTKITGFPLAASTLPSGQT